MRKSPAPSIIAFLILAATVPAFPQEKEPEIPPQRYEVSVRLVLVDVTALDRDGRFDSTLTPDDFEVFEDGKRITLQSAKLIQRLKTGADVPAPEIPSASPAPIRDSRFFVVFDSINTIKRFLDRNKSRILDNLNSLIEIGEQIMVIEMAENGQVNVLQPLTREKGLIAKAVAEASGSIWVEKASDTLAVPSIVQEVAPAGAFGELPGSKFEKTNRDIYELESRRRFEKTVNSLLVVLNMIKDHPGKKSLLFVSGGIPSISFIGIMNGRGGSTIEDSTMIQTQVDAAKIQDPFKALKKQTFRSGQEILEDLAAFANTNNISFYSLDPDNFLRYILGDIAADNLPRSSFSLGGRNRGMSTVEDMVVEIKRAELSTLKKLSENTGGVSFQGGDKYEEFKHVVERDLGFGYELSYAPPRAEADGKYHKITVRTKKPGLDLRFRPGYVDYDKAQEESLLFAAAAYNPSQFKEIPFEARVVPFVLGPGKVSLWIQTALPPAKLLAGHIETEKPILLKMRILVEALDENEGLLSEVAVPLILSPSFIQKNRDAEYLGFACGSQELSLDEGKYRINALLYDEKLGRMGTAESVVSVPVRPEDAPCAVIHTVLGTLSQSSRASGSAYAISPDDGSLLLPGYKFFPMAVPVLDRAKITSALIQVYAPDRNAVLKAGFSLERNGVTVSPLSSKPVHSAWNKKASLWNMVEAFALGDFAPGEYDLRIRLADGAGDARSETTIPVRLK